MTECVSLEEKVILKLREKGMHVTCAESCTGGMIAASLVNVAGVSEVFDAGFVTYANSAKHKLLGVEEEALLTYGAVSPQVAQLMAEGAARQTGEAGTEKRSAEKYRPAFAGMPGAYGRGREIHPPYS